MKYLMAFLTKNLVIVALLIVSVCEGNSLPIPNQDQYSDFLLEPWKPDAPILIIFKDPFCPYCIQALKKKEELKPYNAFLFWYPIFGERSEKRVAELFRCTTPVSSRVLSAVINNSSPKCDGSANQYLMDLNEQMYSSYAPSGVPAYYLGGEKTTLAHLRDLMRQRDLHAPTVNLDWVRYKNNQFAKSNSQLAKIAVVLPKKFNSYDQLKKNINKDAKFTWYIFSTDTKSSFKRHCKELLGGCESEAFAHYRDSTDELSLLYGLDFNSLDKPQLIVDGRLLQAQEAEKYLPVFE